MNDEHITVQLERYCSAAFIASPMYTKPPNGDRGTAISTQNNVISRAQHYIAFILTANIHKNTTYVTLHTYLSIV